MSATPLDGERSYLVAPTARSLPVHNWAFYAFVVLIPLQNIYSQYVPNLGAGLNFLNLMFFAAALMTLQVGGRLVRGTGVNGWVAAYLAAGLLATLIGWLGDFQLAEDALQDALVAALEHWPADGIPDNPGAWLMTTARRRAVDRLRRGARYRERLAVLTREASEMDGPMETGGPLAADDRLPLDRAALDAALAEKSAFIGAADAQVAVSTSAPENRSIRTCRPATGFRIKHHSWPS